MIHMWSYSAKKKIMDDGDDGDDDDDNDNDDDDKRQIHDE